WAKLTKWVDGENCINFWNVLGMLSSGVVLRRRVGMMKTGSTKSANRDIELTCVTIIMLKEMIEERYIATPPANSANEPAIDTPSTPFAANRRSYRLTVDHLFRRRSSAWVSNLTAPQSQMRDTDTDYASPRRSRIFSTTDPQFYFDSST